MTFMPEIKPPTKWEIFRALCRNLNRFRFRRVYYLLNIFFGRIPKLSKFKFPIIKNVTPRLSADDIVSVQPMIKRKDDESV
jgi:hypothetical protein